MLNIADQVKKGRAKTHLKKTGNNAYLVVESLRVLLKLQCKTREQSETRSLRVLIDADVAREQFEDGGDRLQHFIVHVLLDDRHQHLNQLVQVLQNN
jgi:hypothetical protein